jgi:hypothetical protein
MPNVPFDDGLATRHLRPQHHEIPVDGRTHHDDLSILSHKWELSTCVHGMLFLPFLKLQRCDESQSCLSRIPDDVRDVPYDEHLGRRNLQPHMVSNETRQCKRSVRELSFRPIELRHIHLHDVPHAITDRLASQRGARVRIQ